MVLAELRWQSAGCPILGGAGRRILVLGRLKKPRGVEMGIKSMQNVPVGTDG